MCLLDNAATKTRHMNKHQFRIQVLDEENFCKHSEKLTLLHDGNLKSGRIGFRPVV